MEREITWDRIRGANIDETMGFVPEEFAEQYGGRLIIRYRDRAVSQIGVQQESLDDVGKIVVRFHDGRTYTWKSRYVYQIMIRCHGIPLSMECDRIFIPSYFGGLYCLSVVDGSPIWRSKTRKLHHNVMVNTNNTLCCEFGYDHIVILDQSTGEELKRKRYANRNWFKVIGKDKILVQASCDKWEVLNSQTLEVLEVITRKQINTEGGPSVWKRVFKDWDPENENGEELDALIAMYVSR